MSNQLPARMATVVAASIIFVIFSAALSIVWITRSLDRQALEQSKLQVEIFRQNILTRVDMLAVDYAKWDWAFDAIRSRDIDWLYGNIGSAALIGEATQLVVIWGGGLDSEIGWADDGITEPRSGLVQEAILAGAEKLLADTTPGGFDAEEFFQWHNEELFVMAATHFEPVENPARVPEPERLGGMLLMGVRIDAQAIGEMERNTGLKGANIFLSPPLDRPWTALPGLDGEPAAYLSWDPPQPGTVMLARMAPFLVSLTAGASILVALSMRFVKRGARSLVFAEQRASHAARTDTLTGLPNRAVFNDAISGYASPGERAVLFLDINDFKRINDSIGHEAGDQVIVAAAERLAKIVDPSCLLARIGGDEFVFVVSGHEAARRVRDLCASAERAFMAPFDAMGHQLRIRTAMGYAVQVDSLTTGEDLVRQADLAMYEAKRHRLQAPVAFSRILDDAARDAAVVELHLRRALERGSEISVEYQPITDVNGRLVRAEALARWNSLELGRVPPDRFIAVAERAGLIVELGRKLIDLVCKDLVSLPGLNVSLNISPLQLMAPDFIPGLVKIINQHNIEVSRIEIELTESVIVDDAVLAAERLAELRTAGFSIALDDFGTGYSSMGYLARMDFQTLKIDRSFVSKVLRSDGDAAVVDGMIRIAHGLGLRVVCEGVESADECDRLRRLGCDMFQGYYFDSPQSISRLSAKWTPALHSLVEQKSVVVPLWGAR